MKTNIKIIVIVTISFLMLVGGLFFAVDSRKKTISYFYDGGYVINNLYASSKVEINKEYFKENEAYQTHSKDEYAFQNTDGKRVTVSEESFVHYNNGSIMALKDGVAIDLDKIDLEILRYYNIFEGAILSKKENAYQINNLDDTIVFNKLLYKISDNKYLLAADNIVISFSDGQTVSTQDFIEIEYANEDVIRLYNDKVNYQTISSNLYIISDNIKIDVAYKTVSKNDIDLLAMVNMVINANDNIEIVDIKETDGESDKNNNSQNGNYGGGGGSGGSGNGTEDGGLGTLDDLNVNPNLGNNNQETNDNSNETVKVPNIVNPGNSAEDEGPTFTQPKFNVTALNVTAVAVSFSIEWEDPSEVLVGAGDRKVEIVENSTGTPHELEDWSEEMPKYTATHFPLKTNTAYTINVRGSYIVDGETFDRVFVSKIFRTDDLGLEIYTDYITDDDVKFVVEKLKSSDVTGFNYSILEKNNKVVCSGVVGKATIQGQSAIEFDEYGRAYLPNICIAENGEKFKFLPNTNYTLKLDGFVYNNVEYIESTLQETYTVKTLKQSTFLSGISIDYDIDYSTNSLTLMAKNVNFDTNGGIVGYTYKIFPGVLRDVSERVEPLITRQIDSEDKIVIDIKDLRETGYDNFSVKLEVSFDDNEKTILRRYELSEPINIGAQAYPVVVGFDESDEITRSYETISGIITIKDEDKFLTGSSSDYRVVLKEKTDPELYSEIYSGIISSEVTEGVENSKTVSLPVDFINVIPSSKDGNSREYDLYVYVKPSNAYNYIYIGYVTVKTTVPNEIDLKWENAAKENIGNNEYFKVNAYADIGENEEKTLEVLDSIEFELYSCDGTEGCESTGYTALLSNEDEDTSEKLNKLKTICTQEDLSDCTIELSSLDFSSINGGQLTKDVYLAVNRSYILRATGYGKTSNGEYPIKISVPSSPLPMNEIPPSLIVEIDKVRQQDNDDETGIQKDTITGYNINFNVVKNVALDTIEKVNYAIARLKLEDGTFSIPDNCNENSVVDYGCLCNEVAKSQYTSTVSETLPYEIVNDYSAEIEISKTAGLIVSQYDKNKNNGLQRGRSYCLIYSGEVKKENGESKNETVFSGTILRPERQNVILKKGYLKSYSKITGEDDTVKPIIEFYLDINDLDSAGSIMLGDRIPDIKDNIYKFDLSDIDVTGDLDLTLKETLLDDSNQEKSYTLYKFNLGDIQEITDFSPEEGVSPDFNTNTPGQIALTIPLASSVDADKILGVEVNNTLFKIEKNENASWKTLTARISENEFENLDGAVSFVEEGGCAGDYDNAGCIKVDWSKIYLVYDSNEISFPSTNPESRFLTRITDPKSYLYSKGNNKDFSNYLNYEDGINYIFELPEFNFESIQGGLSNVMGYNVNDVSERVHPHLVKKQKIGTITQEKVNEFISVPSTSKIITMYGDSKNDSYISFNLVSEKPQNLMIYKNDNGNQTLIPRCSADQTGECVNVNTENSNVTISFHEFGSLNLEYSIKYNTEDSNLNDNGCVSGICPTYNTYTASLNNNLSISSIGNTAVGNYIKNFGYEYTSNNTGWEYKQEDGEGNDKILFSKRLEIYYDLEYKFNKLDSLNLYIQRNDTQDKIPIKNTECYPNGEISNPNISNWPTYVDAIKKKNYSCTIDLQDYNLVAANYQVIIEVNGDANKDLTTNKIFTISTKEPTVSVNMYGNGQPKFSVKMSDKDGVLTSCPLGENIGDGNEPMLKAFFENFKQIKDGSGLRNFFETSYNDNKMVLETGTSLEYYDSLSDDSVQKMYYLVLAKEHTESQSVSIKSFSAIPFTKSSAIVNWLSQKEREDYFESVLGLGNGNYSLSVLYCIQQDEEVKPRIQTFNFDVTNITNLDYSMGTGPFGVSINIKLSSMDFITSFDWVTYQFRFRDNTIGDPITVDVNKQNSGFGMQSFKMDNSTILSITVSVPEQYEAKDVESLTMKLYKEDPYNEDNLFKTLEVYNTGG